MSKSPYSPQWRAMVAQEYLNGEGSSTEIGKKYNVDDMTVLRWSLRYKENGIAAFQNTNSNKSYTAEFKTKCVELYITGQMSVDQIVAKFNISSGSVLRRWILRYNSNIELKDYDPKQEVYMASAKRTTTLEERKEIVAYCLEHDNDYKNTAVKFNVSYSQVYSWVRKYTELGDDGLLDRRGKHKTDEEVDEVERLRRENLRLKRKLEEKDMLVELLKKLREFEGM